MEDVVGNPLEVGDYLCDDRGFVYRVLPTDITLQTSRVALCEELRRNKDPIYVRLSSALKINGKEGGKPEELKKVYQQAIDNVRDSRREIMLERRREMDRRLREAGRRKY